MKAPIHLTGFRSVWLTAGLWSLVWPALAVGPTDLPDPCKAPGFPAPVFRNASFNVRDFGATGDGATNDTPAINQAIEQCSAEGGGDVVFPEGTYRAASIHLRSHVRFVVQPKAAIIGASGGYDEPEPNPNDKYQDFGHSHFHNAVMWGENIQDFAITGGGRVEGGPIAMFDPKQKDLGDKLIAIASGTNIQFENIALKNGGHFAWLLNDCENVTIASVTLKGSRDAIDLMGCRNVQIHGCQFTGCIDDTLGIKSDWALGRKIETRNIYAWDCDFESGCNGLQFGSETAGDFHNINIWDIRITKALKAGIGITCNDGGVIDGVTYRNISMKRATNPIYLLLTDRLRSGDPAKKAGTIRNVRISHVVASECRPGTHGPVHPIILSGRPESKLEQITLEDIQVTYPGGEKREMADVVPGYSKEYAPVKFGDCPASGLYARHVDGLTLRKVAFAFEAEDQRPPLVFSDINGLVLDGFQATKPSGVDMVRLEKVTNFTVRNSPGIANREGVRIEQGRE